MHGLASGAVRVAQDTSTRTLDNDAPGATPRVLELDTHIERLRSSLTRGFARTPFVTQIETQADSKSKNNYLGSLVTYILRALLSNDAATTSVTLSAALKLTILVTPEGHLYAHRTPLPPRQPTAQTRVLATTALTRDAPTVKDSAFVSQRASVVDDARTNGGYEEVLLLRQPQMQQQHQQQQEQQENQQQHRPLSGYEILEGASSNFLAIDADGVLVTAPDDAVLPGTILRLVLRAANELGVPVFRAPPYLPTNVTEHSEHGDNQRRQGRLPWRAACITSTSRLLLSVSSIDVRLTEEYTVNLPATHEDETVARLRERLGKLLNECSVALS